MKKLTVLIFGLACTLVSAQVNFITESEIDTAKERVDLLATASNSLTAFAGGGQGSATLLTADLVNYVATVATAGDSVKVSALSAYSNGQTVVVYNGGANALDVFPATGEDLGAGTNAAYSLSPGYYIYLTRLNGAWVTRIENGVISETFTILEPDAVQGVSDDIVLKKFVAESYPSGVTITSIHIDASSAYTSETFLFEHWDDAAGTTQATVESIACSAISTEDDGTLSDATIPADYFLVLNLDDTPEDVAYVSITVSYTID